VWSNSRFNYVSHSNLAKFISFCIAPTNSWLSLRATVMVFTLSLAALSPFTTSRVGVWQKAPAQFKLIFANFCTKISQNWLHSRIELSPDYIKTYICRNYSASWNDDGLMNFTTQTQNRYCAVEALLSIAVSRTNATVFHRETFWRINCVSRKTLYIERAIDDKHIIKRMWVKKYAEKNVAKMFLTEDEILMGIYKDSDQNISARSLTLLMFANGGYCRPQLEHESVMPLLSLSPWNNLTH